MADTIIVKRSNTAPVALNPGRLFVDLDDEVLYFGATSGPIACATTTVVAAGYQPLDADLTSWAAITRASGFDTFVATPSSANLKSLVTDETGSGALVFATSPTLATPVRGVASATSINKGAITAPATGSTITIADGKTLTASNTVTLTATDGSTLGIGGGGTLGSAAYTASTAYAAADATLTALAAYNTNGILTQTAADTFTGRTITGTANQVVVTNGNGVSGNPTLSLPQSIHTGATPQFAGLSLYGAFSSFVFTSSTAPTNGTFVGLNGVDDLHIHQREATKAIEFLVNYVTKFKFNSTGIGFYGATPVAQAANTAAATNLATVITLANAMRTLLKNVGLMA